MNESTTPGRALPGNARAPSGDSRARSDSTRVSSGEILRDIEFEIVQGAVGQDDLGQALQAARRFQLEARQEILSDRSRRRDRELALRQFQINDMLLTLLQEMAARLRQTQIELRRTAGLAARLPSGPRQPETGAARATAGAGPMPQAPEERDAGRDLRVEADIRPVRLPILGRLLTRLRAALHSLPVFYTQQLAGQQREVNRALSASISDLGLLLAEQEAQLQALGQRLEDLQARADAGGPPEPE